MYFIDNATAVAIKPTPAVAGPVPNGYFSGGTPGVDDGTVVDPDWLNAVQGEIGGAITQSGQTLNKANGAQLAGAIVMVCAPIGTARALRALNAAAGTTMSWLADELLVGTVLGGLTWKLSNLNLALNLADVGAGGIDIAGTIPNNGFVAIYAIFNPTTGVVTTLATNATTTAAGAVYGGTAMPAGFSASALIGVWPTNGTGQLIVAMQRDRKIYKNEVAALTTTTPAASPTILSIAPLVPLNAVKISGLITVGVSGAFQAAFNLYPTSTTLIYGDQWGENEPGAASHTSSFKDQPIWTPQTIYYTATSSGGSPSFGLIITGYEF